MAQLQKSFAALPHLSVRCCTVPSSILCCGYRCWCEPFCQAAMCSKKNVTACVSKPAAATTWAVAHDADDAATGGKLACYPATTFFVSVFSSPTLQRAECCIIAAITHSQVLSAACEAYHCYLRLCSHRVKCCPEITQIAMGSVHGTPQNTFHCSTSSLCLRKKRPA